MKIDKIYRLEFDEYDMPSTAFYTTKQEALEQLENLKEKIKEDYIDNEQIDAWALITLQIVDLNKSEDLHMFETSSVVSELNIDENDIFYWEDYEVE